MSFEVGQFLGTLFGVDGTAKVEPVEAGIDNEAGEPSKATECPPAFPDGAVDDVDPWPEAEPWPDPCQQCGTLELWENPLGRWRCMKCDPPDRARRLLDKVERLRKRYGPPKPVGNNQ